MTQYNLTSTAFDIDLDEILNDQVETVKYIIETKQKFNSRLDELEARADELKERIAALEQVQVTRQEFDELKARVEMLEKRQDETSVILRIAKVLS